MFLKPNKKLITAVFFVALFGYLLILSWNNFNMPFERDEGEYAYSAQLLRKELAPYKNSFLQKPPLIIYTYGLGQIISPHAVWPPRVLAFVSVCLSLLLVYTVLKKEFSRRAGMIGSWLLAAVFYTPFLSPFAANTEKFLILPLTGLLATYVYFREKKYLRPWLMASALAVATVMYKPTVVPVVCFIFAVWLVEVYRANGWFSAIKRFFIILLGGFVTAICVMLPVILGGAWSYFWEEVIVFNRFYVAQYGFLPFNFLGYAKTFLIYWPFFVVLLIFFLIIRPKKWWFYLGCFVAVLIPIYNIPLLAFGHYYITLMPFWAIICAATLDKLMSYCDQSWQKKMSLAIVAIISLSMLGPQQELISLSPSEFNLRIYTKENPFTESRLVTEKLAEISEAGDNVFVIGSEPQLYFYSNRFSLSRFNVSYPLVLDTPKIKDYQNEVINYFEQDPPRAIVFSLRPYSSFLNQTSSADLVKYLSDFLNQNYALKGGYIWDDDESGHWQDAINVEQENDISFLLFTKKNP